MIDLSAGLVFFRGRVYEKDYFLALVSKIIRESPLIEKLVFKGVTALYHTYLPQLRFSEDFGEGGQAKQLPNSQIGGHTSNSGVA